MTLIRIASALIGASALLLSVSAHAETPWPGSDQPIAAPDPGPLPGAQTSRHAESSFPMKTDDFKKLVESRLTRLRAHLQEGLSKRSLTPSQKADIEKAMDGAVKELHGAVDKVGANGVVSAEEAKHIKTLSEVIRTRIRAELKGKHASAKTKGDKPARAKHGKKPAASKKAARDPDVLAGKDKKDSSKDKKDKAK